MERRDRLNRVLKRFLQALHFAIGSLGSLRNPCRNERRWHNYCFTDAGTREWEKLSGQPLWRFANYWDINFTKSVMTFNGNGLWSQTFSWNSVVSSYLCLYISNSDLTENRNWPDSLIDLMNIFLSTRYKSSVSMYLWLRNFIDLINEYRELATR